MKELAGAAVYLRVSKLLSLDSDDDDKQDRIDARASGDSWSSSSRCFLNWFFICLECAAKRSTSLPFLLIICFSRERQSPTNYNLSPKHHVKFGLGGGLLLLHIAIVDWVDRTLSLIFFFENSSPLNGNFNKHYKSCSRFVVGREPCQTFVKAVTSRGTSGLDIPIAVSYPGQTQLLLNFMWFHGCKGSKEQRL